MAPISLMPHGVCLSWDPNLVAAMLASEVLMGAAYLSVASTLFIFARRRGDFPYPRLLYLISAVFAACGLSHLSDAATIFFPVYEIQALFKAIVALISVPTAVMMWGLLPQALKLPSPASLKAAKEAAEQASRAKSNFLATMSHELRTPLNAVIGFADALETRMFGELNDRQADYLGSIRISGLHLLSLINDILDLTKIDAGRLELEEQTIIPAQLVQMSLVLVGGNAHSRGVLIESEIPADIPNVRGDGLRLKQVLVNLLSNAVKFTPKGGKVMIRAERRDDGSTALTISDTGIGMKPEDVPRAFEMFTQIADPIVRTHGGTGVGLPLSKALVEMHGGRIEVHSVQGEGTTISVVLPADRVVAS